MKREADGTKLVHLADLGGACRANPKMPLMKIAGRHRIRTKKYCSRNDLKRSEALARQGDYEGLVHSEKQRDVLAMGIIMHKALTREDPFPMKDGYPDVKKYRPIKSSVVPDEIKGLIQRMLIPDLNRRIVARDALISFEQFLEVKYPKVFAKIQEKIAKDYPGTEVR